MTDRVRHAREMWAKEKEIYAALCNHIEKALKAQIAEKGLRAVVSRRPKHITSLVKKVLGTGKTYEELTDKAGARAIVRFRDELAQTCKTVEDCFIVVKSENKTDDLEYCETGYQAIHYDVRLKDSDAADRIKHLFLGKPGLPQSAAITQALTDAILTGFLGNLRRAIFALHRQFRRRQSLYCDCGSKGVDFRSIGSFS